MKNIPLYLLLTAFVSNTFAQGTIKESLSIESKILKKDVSYSIYLPDGYDRTNRSYPILYLLHGYSDDETGWTQFGEVQKIADREMKKEEVTDFIIAMPDAEVTWYVNSYDGKIRYEDFFIEEFIPHIESTFRARSKKEFRAVAGLSMGGFGTLLYGLKHPDLFSSCVPLSAAVWTKEYILNVEQEPWDQYFGFIFGEGLSGEDRLTEHVRSNNALFIIEDADPEVLKSVRYYIDCGDDDFLIEGNMALHQLMREKEIPHEFRVRDGEHNWTYWRTALPEVFRFVSVSFHR